MDLHAPWASPVSLAHPRSPAAAPRLERRAVAEFLIPCVLRAHARGELPLLAAIERCRGLLEALPFGAAHQRQEALRVLVSEMLHALPAAPAPAPRLPWWTEACHDLVDFVSREEGLAIARVVKHGATAFERAAELLGGCAVPATPSSVEKARSAWRRARAAPLREAA